MSAFQFSNLRKFLITLDMAKPRKLNPSERELSTLKKLPNITDLARLDVGTGELSPDIGRVEVAQAVLTQVCTYMTALYPDLDIEDFGSTIYLVTIHLAHDRALKHMFSKSRKSAEDRKSVELAADPSDPLKDLGKVLSTLTEFIDENPLLKVPASSHIQAHLQEARNKLISAGGGLLALKSEVGELIQHAKERLPIYHQMFGKNDEGKVIIRAIIENIHQDLIANGLIELDENGEPTDKATLNSLTKAVTRGGSPKT